LRPYIDLNELRGKLIGKSRLNGKLRNTIMASGRADWVGAIILKRDTLPSEAQRNTAEVIKAIDADIQRVVEVEDRLTLERFNQSLFKGGRAYPYNISIDGNDPRGIDVGLLARVEAARGRVERRGLFEADRLTKKLPSGQVRPFSSVTSDTNDASDHAAVWTEFRI
jgi:hypothetical protein